jgi:hypothetical protein
MKVTQLRFEGFLKTPTLWESPPVHELTQFEIEQKSIIIDSEIETNQRLCKFVELFVSHQLANTEGLTLIAENIQISKDRITLGELDCLLYKNGNPIHLEVIYKFYLFDPTKQGLDCWIGPNKKDRLVEKLEKLQQKQLPLLFSKESEKFLNSISLHSADISQQVYFKAQLFLPLGKNPSINSLINTDCIVGFYCSPQSLTKFKNAKFFIPSKKDWLITPHTNVDWIVYEKFLEQSKTYLNRQFSPLCWMKTTTGELKKFFLIWWEV